MLRTSKPKTKGQLLSISTQLPKFLCLLYCSNCCALYVRFFKIVCILIEAIFFAFSDTTSENIDEHLRVKPRSFVFPEADQEGLNIFCYVDVPLPKVNMPTTYS